MGKGPRLRGRVKLAQVKAHSAEDLCVTFLCGYFSVRGNKD